MEEKKGIRAEEEKKGKGHPEKNKREEERRKKEKGRKKREWRKIYLNK